MRVPVKNVWTCLRLVCGYLLVHGLCVGQDSRYETLAEQAHKELVKGEFRDAEKDFRDLARLYPTDVQAQAYLGHALFRQGKFAEAIGPYERAREIERGGKKLALTEHRVLVDQLVMAYGMGGQLKKVHQLLDDAIRQDLNYPLNYYNLACAFAEEGDKSKMLANLDLGFQRKADILKGEQMPDPRTDSSFQKYVGDPDFVNLMKKLGFK